MKTKIFNRIGIAIAMSFSLIACSQDDGQTATSNEAESIDATGMYHYQMTLNCDKPADDTTVGTRALSYTWNDGDVIYARFRSGTSYIAGTCTYKQSGNTWDVSTTQSLSLSNTDANCELYYFEKAKSVDATNVSMDEKTICFFTQQANYKHPNSKSISIKGSLGRKTWRLRFKGASGTTITLPSEKNDIAYFSSFNRSTGNFSSSQKEVSLVVASNGYTDYIYGFFVNSDKNTITLTNENEEKTYKRDLNASSLKVGESAFLDVPTEVAYNGWIRETPTTPNCTVTPDLLVTFTDGFVTSWTVASDVATVYWRAYNKESFNEFTTDEELIEDLLTNTKAKDVSDVEGFINAWYGDTWKANSQYYLVTLAYNDKNVRGELVKTPIKTNATSLPIAEVSNIQAVTVDGENRWTWEMTLKNGAQQYYLYSYEDYKESSDLHFIGWWLRDEMIKGEADGPHDWTNVRLGRDGSSLAVGSWAVDSKGKVGNFHAARSSSSSSRAITPAVLAPDINNTESSAPKHHNKGKAYLITSF